MATKYAATAQWLCFQKFASFNKYSEKLMIFILTIFLFDSKGKIEFKESLDKKLNF